MTDKEQIIIDGVDVSGCLFYQSNFEEDYDVKIKHFCSNWHNSCESANNSNCYFKQLARKTQECEELKAYAQRQENQREEYYKEYLKKDKVLEKIEAATKINCEEICGRKFADCNDTSCFSAEILDIINKVKEGK